MEVLVKIAQFILSISILVILHEFGHFAFAKLFKTRVEKFYLFFNPWFSLFKIKRGETEYGLGWLPLGGYVKISGMIDESMDKEQMKLPAQPHEFRSKTSWQRLLIMIGGVLVNFITALVIYAAILYTWGDQYLPNSSAKYGIAVDSLAYDIGLRDGDKILSLDENKVDNFHDFLPQLILENAKTIQVDRNGKKLDISVPEKTISQLLNSKTFIDVRIPFIIADFSKDSPLESAGFKRDDKFIGINGNPVLFHHDFMKTISTLKNELITITALRGTDSLDIDFHVSEEASLGVYTKSAAGLLELEKIEYGFFAAIPAGINKGIDQIGGYLKQLKLIFNPETKAYKSLGGFITIGNIFPGTWNWHAFWELTALLSIILAVMNLLPIPALDGGHVMFLLYEMVTGRKPGDKFMEYAQMVGMIILLALLLFANGNDIFKLFNK